MRMYNYVVKKINFKVVIKHRLSKRVDTGGDGYETTDNT